MGLRPQRQVDSSRAHPARVYDCLLGGKDNYPVDRELAKRVPGFFRDAARQNRAFMHRSTAWIARVGIDQFLDIGTGIPTTPNLHQVVQGVNPRARVAYVDNDPLVMRHAEALLTSAPEGATDYIEADVRDTARVLEHARTFLDFDRPITLSLVALLHFILDQEDPYGIVHALVEALPSGSHLVLSHTSLELYPQYAEQVARTYNSQIPTQSRTRAEITRFFDGLTFVGPGHGVVTAPEWFTGDDAPPREPSAVYVGVAVKR
ncbi:SAM-dependent methyltransferase [Streptomyces odontomachi]|uniref:SAM-dependent methyltransferase n=1 Tax=Streptomyces odontomachi TaxID=2944940 RepID=UPI00210E5D42|nr:SAM-dependent methyltransferase [Streptomyces sp. ODS25]